MTAVENSQSLPLSEPDRQELRRARAERAAGIAKWVLPFLVLAAALGYWEWAVQHYGIKPYLLPAPSRIFITLVADWPVLAPSLLNTLNITFGALALAVVGGGGLAVVFAQSRWVEMALVPFAIILQVTPVVAIA